MKSLYLYSLITFAIAAMGLTAQAGTVMTDATTHPGSAPSGGDGHADLAKQLANPIASLISVPFQNNYDFGLGPNSSGTQWKMNIQPVIPISVSEDWNLITRTILPVISQRNVAGTQAVPSGTQSGIGDTVMSLWLSPKAPTKGGLIWGVGPAFNLKTASDRLLGSGKWGVGPTAVALKQIGPWTVGGLVNHLWSVAGDSDRASLNNTFLQPFVSYTTGNAVTYTLNTESSYNWQAHQWTIPINLAVAKVTKIGNQPVQFLFGGRWYPAHGGLGPEWGLRANVTFLFPKG